MTLQVKLIGALCLVAALAAAYLWGRVDGRKLEAAAWTEREAAIAADVAVKLKEASDRVLAVERRRSAELAMVSAAYQTQLQENENAKERVIAGLRDGTRRMYIDARCPPGGGAVSGAPAGAGGRDGEARAELSSAAAEFLVRLAAEADAVVQQLTACQAVLGADRAQ